MTANKKTDKPKLIFTSESLAGQSCNLSRERNTVGRSSGNSLVIRHPSVSAAHAEILVYEYEVIVRDLNSSNGTYVQGGRVNGQTQLKHGQVVRFGDVSAKLELPMSDFDPPTTEETAIREHAQAMSRQRREQKSPGDDGRPRVVGGGPAAEEASGDHTVLITPVAKAPEPSAAPDSDTPPGGAASRSKLILVIAAAIAAAVAVWLIFR